MGADDEARVGGALALMETTVVGSVLGVLVTGTAALGAAFLRLERRVERVARDAETRETFCRRHLSIHRRRQLLYEQKMSQIRVALGEGANGEFGDALGELEGEETELLAAEGAL